MRTIGTAIFIFIMLSFGLPRDTSAVTCGIWDSSTLILVSRSVNGEEQDISELIMGYLLPYKDAGDNDLYFHAYRSPLGETSLEHFRFVGEE